MKYFIILLCLAAIILNTKAQTAADYDFEQINSAPYPVITGTVNTTTLVPGSDELFTTAVPIGFSFAYCGTVYTSVRISCNGFISPGTTLNQAAFTNDLAGTIKPVIAPLWDDLAVGTAGSVVYTTEGTSPNRVFIVEFRYMKWMYTATNENRHFQVRLYETSNVIEFNYNIIDAAVNGPAASVGISDPTGGAGHFMSVSPSSSATVSTITANNAINTAQYLNGLMYRFTPSACPAPTSFVASNITHNSATLTWINAAATDIKYQIFPFNPLTQGILLTNVTNPYFAIGLYANTTYYIYLRANCGGGVTSDWTGPFTFKTLCPPNTGYPVTEGLNSTVPPTCWFETIVATAGTTPDWYYTYSGINPVVTPFEGTGMACFNSFDCYTGAQARLESSFFDFSGLASPMISYQMYHDNAYDYTTTEGVQVQVSLNGSNWINAGTFNMRYSTTIGWAEAIVDLSAYSGMSVRIGFLGTSQFGNNMFIDDIFIGDVPLCFPPTGITISDISASSATVTWIPFAGSLTCNYELGSMGFTPGTHTEILAGTTTANSITLTPLSSSTSYDFYILTDCDTNGLSTWAGPFTITTSCYPQTTLPYTVTFSGGGGSLPTCWTANHNSLYTGSVNWQKTNSDPNGAPSGYGGWGSFVFLDCFNGPVEGNPYNLNSKPVHIPAPYYKLYYYYWIGSGYSSTTPIITKISANDGITWTTVATHDMSVTDTWAQKIIPLFAYNGQDIIVRFEGYSDWGYGANNLGIDQFEIKSDKTLLYSSYDFNEDLSNNGSIRDTIGFKLIGETFNLFGALTEGVHFTTTNVPAGLTANVEVVMTDSARFYLTGNALSHSNTDDISNLKLEFLNAAFNGNVAANVYNYKVDTIGINFIDFLLINEADADQTGSDTYEFIEIYDGGIGNYSLDNYCMVLYNGSTDLVYNVFDLDSYSTDSLGYFVIGTPNVTTADMLMSGNTLQNGQDAIAIYEGHAADFPVGAAISYYGLVDAVVYDNGQADDPVLLTLDAPGEPQINENEYNMGTVYSFQRIPNGSGGMLRTYTFSIAPPTPGIINAPAPMLVWPTDTFYESLTDDGSIETVMTLTLLNDTFKTSGLLQESIHYTSQNMPAGLQFQLTILNDTTVEVGISGNAINHSPPDNVSNLQLNFWDTCYTDYPSPLIIYSNRNDLKIIYTYSVNVETRNIASFQFYPNPAGENLFIRSTKTFIKDVLTICDISGREVMAVPVNGNEASVNIRHLVPGMYLLKIRSEQGILIKN